MVTKLFGRKDATASDAQEALVDGAIDTLEALLRATGEFSFPLTDEDPRFHDLCKEYARHVANGAPILDEGIEASTNGHRQWPLVRQFFLKRRQQEVDFVTQRTHQYQGLVQGMVTALSDIATGETDTRQEVETHLKSVSAATANGDIDAVKRSLERAMAATAKAFEAQKSRFDSTLDSTQSNLVQLREDFANNRDLMTRDPVTGTFSADAFNTALKQSIALNFVLQQPIAVVAIQIADFSSIQASVGAAAGDETLRSVVDCLMRCFVRRSDTIATLKPGLFMVLLADTNETTAKTLNARVEAMVRDTVRVPYANEGTTVRCVSAMTMLLDNDQPASVLARLIERLPQSDATENTTT
ncbi:MAG: diguanylate cyclase [Pseudomonadota bacterium]